MKHLIVFYTLFFLGVFSAKAHQENPQDDTKLTKTINRSFKVGISPQLFLTNKYGQVAINTWQKDSIKVAVEITAIGKATKATEALLSRVDISFVQNTDIIKIETLLDKKDDIFDEIWSKITNYSKALLSEQNLKINYTVFVPEKTQIEINNKFGDVFLDKLTARSKVYLAYGDLRANELANNSLVDLRYGSASIKQLQDATLRFQIAEAEVLKSKKVSVESHSSTIYFTENEELSLNSRNDKIRIEQVAYLNGTTSFSKVRVEELASELALFMSYGELDLRKIKKNFESMRIDSKSTDLSLRFDKDAYYEIEMLENGSPKPKTMDLAQGLSPQNSLADKNNSNSHKKIYGKADGKLGKVIINAQKGEVKIW